MRQIAYYSIWLFVFVIPWEHAAHIEGIGSLGRLSGFLLVGLCAPALALGTRIRLPTPYHLLLTLFVVWAGLSAFFWTLDPARSIDRLWTYVQQLIVVFLIWQFVVTRRQHRELFKAYVLGAYVAVAATINAYVSAPHRGFTGARFVGFDTDPNILGLKMALGIPMAWYLTLRSDEMSSRVRWLCYLYIASAMLAILLTASRGAFLAAGTALLVIPWTYRRMNTRRKLTLVTLVVLATIAAGIFIPRTSWERLATIPEQIRSLDLNKRVDIWRAGVEMIKDHFLLGVGAGAFRTGVLPYLGARFDAHNVFISVLGEYGLIGIALFVCILAAAIRYTLLLPPMERKVWTILFATWLVGALSLNYDYAKPTWYLLGSIVAFCHAQEKARATRGQLRVSSMSTTNGLVGLSNYARTKSS